MTAVRSTNHRHGPGRVTHTIVATFTYAHRMACGAWITDVTRVDLPVDCAGCLRVTTKENQ